MALEITFEKSKLDQKSTSFIEESVWNKLVNDFKILNATTSFSQNCKKIIIININTVFIIFIIVTTIIVIIIITEYTEY